MLFLGVPLVNKILLFFNGFFFLVAGWIGYQYISAGPSSSSSATTSLFKPLNFQRKKSPKDNSPVKDEKITIESEKFIAGLRRTGQKLLPSQGGEGPIANFPFHLKGIILGPSAELTFVFLETKNTKEQKTYHEGDFIEGFKISRVAPEFIELKQGKRTQKLFISYKTEETPKMDKGKNPLAPPKGDSNQAKWIRDLAQWVKKNPKQFKQMAQVMRRQNPREFQKKMQELKKKNRPLFKKVKRLLQ